MLTFLVEPCQADNSWKDSLRIWCWIKQLLRMALLQIKFQPLWRNRRCLILKSRKWLRRGKQHVFLWQTSLLLNRQGFGLWMLYLVKLDLLCLLYVPFCVFNSIVVNVVNVMNRRQSFDLLSQLFPFIPWILRVTGKCEAHYAKCIQKRGIYLGLLDLALLAMNRGKDILLVPYDDELEGPPKVRALSNIIRDFAPDGWQFPGQAAPDITSPDTWVLALTNAKFVRAEFQMLNHYMPVFPQQQLADDWHTVATTAEKKLDSQMQKALKRRTDALKSDDDPAWVESVLEYASTVEDRVVFYRLMLKKNFIAADVPCDGDCMLWALRAVASGYFVQLLQTTDQDIDDMREEPGHGDRCFIFMQVFLK